MRRRPENMWNKVQRFSIRKFSFGVTSALVGTFFLANASMVQASSIEKEAGIQKNQLEINKVAEDSLKENKVEVKKEKTVEKNHLSEVINELTDILATVNKDKVSKSSLLQFETALSQAKSVLQNESATQEEVDSVVRSLKNSLSIIKSMPKLSTSSEEKEKKNAVPQKETVETASPKTQEEKNASLKQIQKDLQNYLTAVGEKENKETKIDEAKSILANITTQLENPTLSSEELTVLLKQASQVRNSIVNEVLRETSGARDPRNGQSIGEGVHFSADGQISSGALANIKYFASVDPNENGGRRTINDNPELTKEHTDIKAYYMQDSEGKWIVYDVFFNNNGRKMTGSSYQQHYYFQAPFNIMDPSNTVRDLTFTRYRNTGGRRLSDGFQGFEQYGNTATITNPWSQQNRIFNADPLTFYDPNSGVTRDNQRWDVFKNNQYDSTLNQLPKNKNGQYPGLSYHLGLDVRRESTDYAVHMHAKIKLKNDITEAEANAYGRAYAASVTKGPTTNQSYIMGTLGTSLTPRDTTPPTITANGAIVTKNEKIVDIPVTAVDNTGGVGMRQNNPIEVTGLPQGLTFTNGKITGTPTGPVGNSTVTIKAYDKNGNKAEKTITITVKDQASKYNPTGETLTVNQGQTISDDAVKAKVKNYAPGSLTVLSKPSTAKPGNVGNAVVKVTYPDGSSENVNVPVTVLEAPDTQPPTLAITPANQTVVEGQNVTFTVTARDNKHVNLEANDFLTKYGTRVFSGKASIASPTDTATEKIRRITITTTAEDIGKTNTITFNATDNANHRATPVTFTFTVTSRDNIAPTITAGNATVTSREQITPISVTAEDNRGGVGIRDNNPIEVSGLPSGLTYANNRITGTPTGAPGNSTVTIKAYDKNGNMGTKTITITVRSQADAHNPTGTGLTVNQNHAITDAELKAKVSNFAPGTLSIVSRPSTANAGNAGNAVVKVTYPDGTFDNVNVPVTVTDVTGPTITANNATVTNREQITPIPVTAVDNTGGVGMRQNKPIEVTGLPAGLTYANNQITGTPTGAPGNSTVTIKAYDRNNTPTTKTITITVRSQADVHNPTGAGLTVNQNHTITDAELKAKVSNYAPGTLSIVSRPSTARAGNAGNAVVKVTYPDGTFDNVNVPVTVTDVTGPTITANNATVTNREQITPIPVTAVDNTGGVGMRQNKPIEVTGLPAGLTYSNGRITGTPTGAPGNSTVTIKAYDRNNTPTTKTITITVRSQADVHNPTGETLRVPYNHNITDNEVKEKVKNFTPGTLTVKSKPLTNTSGNVGNAVVTVTYPDGSQDTVDVPVIVGRPNKDDYTPKYDDGRGKPGARVEIPLKEENGKDLPPTATYVSDQPGIIAVDNKGKVTVTIPADKNPGDKVTGKITVRYPDGSIDEVPVSVTVINRDKDDYTPKYDDGRGKPGARVEIPLKEENGKDLPPTATYVSDQPGIIAVDNKGKVTVTIPADKNPGDKITGKITVTYPDGSIDEVPVSVTVVNRDKDDYTPKYDDGRGKPGARVEIPLKEENGKDLPPTATYVSDQPGIIAVDNKGKVTVTIPADKNPGDKVTGKITVRYPDGSIDEVPVSVTVINRDKDDYTPKYEDGTGKPGARVEIPLKEENGKDLPPTATYVSDQPGIIAVDNKGKVTVTIPADKNPGDKVTGKITVTYPDGSIDEVPVSVTVVNRDKDNYTPKYADGTGKPGESVDLPLKEENGKDLPPTATYVSDQPGIIAVDNKGKVTVTIPADKNPGDKITGKITVTYPDGSIDEVPVSVTVVNRDKDDYTPKYDDGRGKPGARVEIPLKEENGKDLPPTATYVSDQPGIIAVDNKGKVTVTIPADKNPGDKVTGKITVTYPDGSIDEVPVSVTVVNRDKDDYTPKYDDGRGKPGARVEIPLKEENGKDLPPTATYVSDQPGIIAVDNKGKVTVTIPADKNPGDKVTGKITVTYPDGSIDEVPVSVTVINRDKDNYTPKYEDGRGKPGASVDLPLTEENGKDLPPTATYVSDQPGIIAVDNKGKVTVTIPADKNPGDKVTGKITVTYPDGSIDEVPVSVTVINRDKDNYTPKYEDGRGKPGASVEIPLKEENGKDLPPTATYVSDQPGIIAVDNKGKVTVTIPADKNPGDKVTGKITVTYPDGSIDEVPVSVTVINRDKDNYTPKYDDGTGKPGASVEIPLKEENGKDLPPTATYTSLTPGVVTVDDKGKVTVTIPADKNPGDEVTGKVLVRYPDGSEEEVPVKVTVVNRDKDDYTPKYDDGTGKPGESVEIPVSEANGKDIPTGTTYTSLTPGVVTVDDKGKVTVTIPADKNPGDEVTGKVLVRYPDGSEEEVPVKVTVVNRDKDDYTPKYDDGNGKPGESVEIPVSEANGKDIPTGTTYTSLTPGVVTVDDKGKVTVTIPADKNPGDEVTGKVLVRYPDGSEEEVPVKVTVVNRDKDDYTPKYDDGNGKPGESVEIPVSEANGKDIPTGTTYTSLTPGVVTVDDKGKVTVTIPADKNPGDEVTGKVLVRYPDGSEEEVPVKVTVVNRDKDDYTPKYDDGTGKPGESVEIPVSEANGKDIPTGTTYTSLTPGVVTVDDKGKVTVTIPADKNPGDEVTGKVLVRYPDGSEEEVPVKVTVVNRDKDDYTPKYDDGNGKPGESVEIPVSEANGKDIPTGTTYTSLTPGVVTVDDKGKVTVTIPADKNPGDEVTGKVLVRYPDGSEEEVPVKVTVVNRDKDDYTPKYDDGNGKPGESVEIPVSEANGKDIPTGTTYTSLTPGVVTVDDKGKVTVTIPADKNPGDEVTGKVLVRYPDGSEEEVPVKVTVVNRDKDDYTPKYDDGNGKPGSKVEIPLTEENGKKIPERTTFESDQPGVIAVDKDGKVTVTIPEGAKPGDKITGKVLVRYPDGSTEEVPVTITVTPPENVTPTVELEQNPKTGDVTVTPKKPDGTLYPENTKVEIPGKDKDNPIVVIIGQDGKGKVPNNDLPDGDIPGIGKITEPGKDPVEVPVVTTPAKLTPTVELEQDPNTGDVTVTPKKPDGSTYPPGTKVEIPGKNGTPIVVTIGQDGKGKVPNNDLPDGDIPGIGKITEPGKDPVEVNVKTPKKLDPNAPQTEQPGEIEITRKPNGDAVVTPKKPDGTTYPPGTKVVIPGDNNTPIEVTIGDNGSGEVPNDKLPKGDLPGKGIVTEPNKRPSNPVDVTTPARKIPTVELEQDPNTGDVTVTPKKPDGSTYPPGTKVEIPGKNGKTITVIIGQDGKGKVPNNDLPDGEVPGIGKITEPGKPTVEVNVKTPKKLDPNAPQTEQPGEIEITRKPNGDAVVTPKKPDGTTYPPGTKVVIPGDNNTPIEVTIGDNGSGEVPNDKLPKGDLPGKGTVTEPNKRPSQPVDVTTPARKTPTVELEQDPNTGDVTVTPKKPDGSTYPPGTKVEIPGKNGKTITVIIGEDGKGKVPNSELPDGKVPGVAKITEPGKPTEEVPVVTTPARKTPTVEVDRNPNVPQTEQPIKIEITRKPNGDAVVTPKKPDGSTYPPGTRVLIPGDNNTPIEVIIGENGSGEVPNDKLPKGDLPGKGIVTEPNKRPSNPVDVTTPARKTPTSELEQNPKTSDESETSKDNQTPAQETPATAGEPVQQTQDTNQNILPNTGTADGLGIFSAAAASILSGLGLVVFGKKEDEEEENN